MQSLCRRPRCLRTAVLGCDRIWPYLAEKIDLFIAPANCDVQSLRAPLIGAGCENPNLIPAGRVMAIRRADVRVWPVWYQPVSHPCGSPPSIGFHSGRRRGTRPRRGQHGSFRQQQNQHSRATRVCAHHAGRSGMRYRTGPAPIARLSHLPVCGVHPHSGGEREFFDLLEKLRRVDLDTAGDLMPATQH